MAQHRAQPTMGALPPPPGITPNFADPPSLQGGVIAVLVVALTVTTLCIGLRVASRLADRFKNAGWDDYTAFFAWACMVPYELLVLKCNKYGNGIHMWDVTAPEVVQLAKIANVAQIYYSIPIYFTKLSILLQFLRIFVVNRTGMTYYTIQALIWINSLFYTAVIFALIFACSPRDKTWDTTIPGHCINQNAIFIALCVVNVVTNILCLAIPLNCLRKLQMPLRRKLGISLVFMTGIFAFVTSLIWLVKIVRYSDSPDFSYNAAVIGQWTQAELTAGLVAGCMPTFPQLFRRAVPKASVGLRGYWSRAISTLTSKNSGQSLVQKTSWESQDQARNYIELDEHNGRVYAEERALEHTGALAWGQSGRGETGLANSSEGKEKSGIRKTIELAQEHV